MVAESISGLGRKGKKIGGLQRLLTAAMANTFTSLQTNRNRVGLSNQVTPRLSRLVLACSSARKSVDVSTSEQEPCIISLAKASRKTCILVENGGSRVSCNVSRSRLKASFGIQQHECPGLVWDELSYIDKLCVALEDGIQVVVVGAENADFTQGNQWVIILETLLISIFIHAQFTERTPGSPDLAQTSTLYLIS